MFVSKHHQARVIASTVIQRRHCATAVHRASQTKDFSAVPAAFSLPIIGTALSLIAAGSAPHYHKYVHGRHRQLGHIFKERIGPIVGVFLDSPSDMRTVFAMEGKHPVHLLPEAWTIYNRLYGRSRGLFFMDGEEWWHYRKLMNKHLLRSDTMWMQLACDHVCNQIPMVVRSEQAHYVRHDIQCMFYKWSLETIVALLLGHDTYSGGVQHRLDAQISHLAAITRNIFITTSKLMVIPASLASKWRLPRWSNFVHSVDDALFASNRLVDSLMRDHSTNSSGLLSRMLADNISKEKIAQIIADLILASGDTTANTLQWILYALATNRHVQDELRLDLKRGRTALLHNVVRESLRLYPVAPFLTRFLPQNTIIRNYCVPKGALVILSIYTSGRNGGTFKQPDEFRPNRWLRDDPDYNSEMALASLPFAMGARSCIGRKIAEIQLETTTAKLVENFHIDVHDRHRKVEMVMEMVAVPSRKLHFKFDAIQPD